MTYEITRRGFIATDATALLCGPAFGATGTLDTALINAQFWNGGGGMIDAVGIAGDQIAAPSGHHW